MDRRLPVNRGLWSVKDDPQSITLILDHARIADHPNLQLSLQEFGHLRVQVPGGISTRNPMVAIGVIKRFKLLVRCNECVDQVHCILEVDIVISGTMY